MRKIIFIIFALVYSCFSINADEYLIYQGSAYQYNDFLKGFVDAQFLIKYDDEEEIYYIFTSDIFNDIWIDITSEQLAAIRSTVSKFIDWEKIATDKQVEIDKQIPDSEIDTSITWKYGDDWYFGSNFKIYFSAFSQNTERHQLVISSNKVDSKKNKYISAKLDTLYLDIDQVLSFDNGINQGKIQEIINEHNKMKKNQDLFN